MNFEWDPAKADSNLRRHGVDFVDAIGAVLDPDRIEDEDLRFDYDEERTQIIGMAARGVLRRRNLSKHPDLPHHLGAQSNTT